MKVAIAQALDRSYSYSTYRKIISGLLEKGESSGLIQSADLLHYSQMNNQRMDRWDKSLQVPEAISQTLFQLKQHYTWLVLTEGWCGDAAHIVPVMNKLATICPNITLKLAFRDENDALMQSFLTNGSRSIPKLIVLDSGTLEVRASWGPRPKPAAQLIESYKRQYGSIDDTAKTELQLWYNKDKGLTTEAELSGLMTDVENALYAKR